MRGVNVGRSATLGLLACAVGLVAALIFLPHLNAGLVSDTFYHLEAAKHASFSSLLAQYVPGANRWYRPTTYVVYWLEYRLFGLRPLGYHVIAFLCHVISSILIVLLSRRMTGNLGAGLVAGIAFLFSVHTHEVLFDVADLHHSLGAVALLGCVLAYAAGNRAVSVLLAVGSVTSYEAGILSLPLVGLYELTFRIRMVDRHAIRASAWRLAPFVVLSGAYMAARRLMAGPLKYEVVPCWTVKCLAVAVLEYVNRLFVRPDALRAAMPSHRPALAIASLTAVSVLLVLLGSWRWRRWRAILFGAGWLVGTTLFYILALFPYVSDRFVYLPDTGLALCVGAIAAETWRSWPAARGATRIAMAVAAGALMVWLATGALMLSARGASWDGAGTRDQEIIESLVALIPSPPPSATFVFRAIPDSDSPKIPPGNTGPYLFRNGLGSAVRLRYGRSDLVVKRGEDGGTGTIALTIEGNRVRLAE